MKPATKSEGTASTATPWSAMNMPVCPVATKAARAPPGLQRARDLDRGGHLAHVAVAPHGEHHRRRDGGRAPRRDRPARRRAARVVQPRAAARGGGGELGVVAEEGVEPGEHVPAALERLEHAPAPRRGQLAALRRDADEQAVGAGRGGRGHVATTGTVPPTPAHSAAVRPARVESITAATSSGR